MNKRSKKPSQFVKALKIGAVALVGAGLVTATIIGAVGSKKANDKADALSSNLAKVNAELNIALTNLEDVTVVKEKLESDLASMGLQLEELSDEVLAKDEVIADYAAINAELSIAAEDFVGYDEDVAIDTFDLGTLNDNQFEKLADTTVSFDGEEVDVNEYLSVKGNFEHEDEVALSFEEADVVYKLTFDAGLDFDEDSLELSLLGSNVEIIDISAGEMIVKMADKAYANEGTVVNGVKVVRIADDSVIVSDGTNVEIISKGATEEVGDVKVSIDDIFYIEGANDNIVVLRVGEDLNKVVEVGDFFDEAEMWEYTSISDGEIVISLAEEVEAVNELVLPNDFATISFELSEEDYNSVEVVKKNNIMDEVVASFEDYDSNKVEFNGTSWVIENDNGDDEIVTSLELKDSLFTIDFINSTDVVVAGVNVSVNDVAIVGDEDLDFITSEGVIVSEHDSWNEDDDESIVISVPENVVEAKLLIE